MTTELIDAGTAKKKKFRRVDAVPSGAYDNFYTQTHYGLAGVASPDWKPEPFRKIKSVVAKKKILRFGTIGEDVIIAKHPRSNDKILLSRIIERYFSPGKYTRQSGKPGYHSGLKIIHYSITDIPGYSHIQRAQFTIPKSAEEKTFEVQAPMNRTDYKAIHGGSPDVYTLFVLFNEQWSKGTDSIKQGLLIPLYSIDSRLPKDAFGEFGHAFLVKFKSEFTEFHYFNIFRFSHHFDTGLEAALNTKLK